MNGYLSRLIVLTCLKVDEKRRMLVPAMMKIEQLQSSLRGVLRGKLIRRCREIKEPETKRDERIWSRRECVAKGNGKRLVKKVDTALENIQGRTIWKKYLNSKMKAWSKNIHE